MKPMELVSALKINQVRFIALMIVVLALAASHVAAQPPAAVEVIFSENFDDGELLNDPIWNFVQNNAYFFDNGAFHADGLIQDQSDRYRLVMQSAFDFATTGFIDLSYESLLKTPGNPQQGRGTLLAISGPSGDYSIRVTNGRTDGFPTNKASIALVGGTGGTQFDIIRTTYAPNFNQWYAVQAVRENGMWTLYVDGVSVGTAPDPLGLMDFTSVTFGSVGSTASDNLLVKVGSDSEGSDRVTICHVAGNSGEEIELQVNSNAVDAHLAHGDSLGACG